jgi:hypothetical protein
MHQPVRVGHTRDTGGRARGREVKELVHADAPMSVRTHSRVRTEALVSMRTSSHPHGRIGLSARMRAFYPQVTL